MGIYDATSPDLTDGYADLQKRKNFSGRCKSVHIGQSPEFAKM